MTKKKILVADDELGFRLPYLIYLKQHNFNAIEASNKDEVFAEIVDVDLLMMDVMFPDPKKREGIGIVRKIREKEDETIKNIPVIFYSVLPESACTDELSEDLEPYIWLQKPFEFETLLDKIKELIF